MKKSTLTVFFIIVGCMLFLSGIWIYFQKKLDQVDLGEGEGASSYAKHYLMIAGAENTLMWDSIYESASQAAKDADAYLELIEPGTIPIIIRRIICVLELPPRWTGSFWKLMEAMKSRN